MSNEELLKEYNETFDEKIKEQLIINNMPLVKHIANKYVEITGIEIDDLCGYGYLGLLSAINLYNPTLSYIPAETSSLPLSKVKSPVCLITTFGTTVNDKEPIKSSSDFILNLCSPKDNVKLFSYFIPTSLTTVIVLPAVSLIFING